MESTCLVCPQAGELALPGCLPMAARSSEYVRVLLKPPTLVKIPERVRNLPTKLPQ
jgi:hypothetical protein